MSNNYNIYQIDSVRVFMWKELNMLYETGRVTKDLVKASGICIKMLTFTCKPDIMSCMNIYFCKRTECNDF